MTKIKLILGESYKYPINPQLIPDDTEIYIHDSNRQYTPDWRPFWLWKGEHGRFIFTRLETKKWRIGTAMRNTKIRTAEYQTLTVAYLRPRWLEKSPERDYLDIINRDPNSPVVCVSAPSGW